MLDVNSVVFIDSQVQGLDDLITGLPDNTSVHHLGSRQDGVEQISQILAQYENLDAVYIFSHGSEGSLDLGTTVLNQQTLDGYRQSISGWSQALSDDADLLFFGCNVAEGQKGQAFIRELDELTGADIAASTDLTGHAELGRDWTLEAATGNIESYHPFVADSLTNYKGTLASLSGASLSGASLSGNITGTREFSLFEDVTVDGDLFLDGDVTLNVGDFTLGSNFNITGNDQGARDNLTIVSSGKVTIAGDIFGGGLQNVSINASEIDIQGTSLISTRFIEGADYSTSASTGDSGDLTLEVGDRIAIQPGAQLFSHVGNNDTETAGNITITALDKTIQTNLLAFPTAPHRSTSIDIDGATIKGNDVTVSASSLDPRLFGDVVDFPGVQFVDQLIIDPLLEKSASFLQGLVTPASVEVRISHAKATVTGSSIEASGAVTIGTEATADSSVRAVRATQTPQDADSKNPIQNFLSHFAVAVGYAETDAVTNVEGTTINAGSDVSVVSSIKTAATANARLFGNLQSFGQGASKENFGLTAAVALTDTTSKVLLDKNSSITSGGNVAITSGGQVASGAKANNAIFLTGTAAAGIAVNHDDTEVTTLVHGDITAAGTVTEEAPVLIASANVEGDAIAFNDLHDFQNGETVTYQNTGNGADISGLASEQTYIVHVEDDQTIKLSRGAALKVNAGGVNQGAIHSLSRLGNQAISQVDVDTDQITLQNHGLLTGQQVTYRSNADEGQGIEGLLEEVSYVVRVVDSNTIELVGDLEQLTAGETVDITSAGNSENIYTLELHKQEEQVQTFSPSDLIDTGADTLNLNNHGFYNGQLVRYSSPNTNGEVGGLRDEQYYFVIVNDSNTLQLAETQQDVDNRVAIDLTDAGNGSGHQLIGLQNATRFEAKTAVDSDKNIFTVNNHGFQTGDAVVYDTDASLVTEAAAYINRTLDPSTQIDLANNTISLAAKTLETGDKVVYQSAYALDANSAQNQAIGGLTSATEYYVVKLDDETIQLAASQAQALAGETIELTSVGTGDLHTLSGEGNETVLTEDREIRGLEASEIYYVSVIDGDTFRLTNTSEEAVNAEFITLDDTRVSGNHQLQRQAASTEGVTIEADLVANDRAIASAQTVSTPRARHYFQNPDLIAGAIANRINPFNQAKIGDILNGNKGVGPFQDQPIGGNNQKSLGLGVAVNLVNHDVRVEVGSDANGTDFDTLLNSEANLQVNSGIKQRVQTRTSGATGTSGQGSVGLAVGVSDYDNTAQSIIHGNAQLNAEETIDVTANVEYPLLFDTDSVASLGDSEDGDLTANFNDEQSKADPALSVAKNIGIDGLFGGNLLLTKFTNTFANTKKLGKVDGGSIGGFNGTIAVNNYNNVSEALIKSGAQINQNQAYYTEQQSVNVQADTDMLLIGLVGMLHMDIAADVVGSELSKPKSKRDFEKVFNPFGTNAQNGVGASVFVENIDNQTIAKIEGGAQVRTGTQGDGLDINAKEKVLQIGLTQSGAQVEGFGLAGSGAGFIHTSDTIAQVESGTTITGGALDVQAHSDAVRVNSALTLVKTEGIGLGFAVAIDESDRNVRAVIGDATADDTVLAAYQSNAGPTTNTLIDVLGNIDVNAKTTGAVVSAALGFNSLSPNSAPEGEDPLEDIDISLITFASPNPPGPNITPVSLRNLVGLTGGVAGNLQTETVQAYIYDAQGNDQIKARSLTVESKNQTLTLALGALLTAASPQAEVTATGSQNVFAASLGVAINEVDHTTSAFIEGATVEAQNLQIAADKDRDEGSRTLAIAFTPSLTTSSTGEGSFTANVSGAVALNSITSTTESYANNSILRIANDTTFTATDKSGYYAAGGALSLGVLTSISDYKGTATLGFGFGRNTVNSTTQGYLNQSILTSPSNANGQIEITALSDFESIALSLSGALSSNTGLSQPGNDTFGFSGAAVGAVSMNEIDQNTISAYISNSTVSAPAHSLAIKAEDSSHILGIGGGVSISAITQKDNPLALSLGVSAAVNTFENTTVEAYVSKSTLTAGEIDLTAISTADSGAYAIIGAGAGTSANPSNQGFSGALAGAGAGTGNYGSSTLSAQIREGSELYTHALALHALDETQLKSYAIGLSVAANANSSANAAALGAGVAVAINEVNNNVHANITGASTVNRLGNSGQVDVDLQALSTPDITSVNVAGAASAGLTGQGSVGVGIGAGVSVAHTTLSNTVSATIEDNSKINHGGTVSLQALLGQTDDKSATIRTIGGSVGLAAAWSNNLGVSLAVAASVAKNQIENNTVVAAIDDATVTASGDIEVVADLTPTVHATNFGIAAAAGGGGKLGIQGAGAGIGSYNTLENNSTEVLIENQATVTSQAGKVSLKATDKTELKAHGGTGALAVGGSASNAGISGAIGVAIAENKIDNTTAAAISKATVTAQTDINVDAEADNHIDALNIGVGAAAGLSGGSAGVGFAGTGTGSTNTLSNAVSATIKEEAQATAETGTVHVNATDTSQIKADGGAGSLAFGGSSSGGASAAVGISIAENTLNNSLTASIDNATVTAEKDVLVAASNQSTDGSKVATIEAISVGASLAGAVGGSAGIALAGAGVGADNTINNTIEASIQNSQVTSHDGTVNVAAEDKSKIDAQSYVVSISAAAGTNGAGSGSLGIAKATNTLSSTVQAFVGQKENTPDSSHITAAKLDVSATSDTEIDAQIVTASAAIAVAINPNAPIAIGLSGSGVIADNTIGNTVEAAIRTGSTLEIADSINVEATDTSDIDAAYGVGSLGAGVLAGASIAVALTENTLDNQVQAYMNNALLVGNAAPDVTIRATETVKINADNRFASVGGGIVGLAGAGASSTSTINTVTEAYAQGNQDWTIGDLDIQAVNDTDSAVKVHGGAGAVSAVGVAAGASLATVEDNSQATAYFDLNNAVLKAKDVIVSAIAKPKAIADALFVAIATGGVGLAGAGSKAKATIDPTVTAYIGEGTIIDADSLTVEAEQAKPENGETSVSAITTTGESSAGLSLGLTYADAYANGTVKAYIADDVQLVIDNDITVTANNKTEQFVGKDGIAGGGINLGTSGGALHANTHSNKTTEAYIGDDVALTAQNLTLQANGENNAEVAGVTFGGAGVIAGRSGHAETHSTSTTRAHIGEGDSSRRIKVLGTVDVDATNTNTFDKDLVVATGSLLAAGSGANAKHIVDSTVEASFGDGLQVEAGDIQVDALNTSRKLNKDETSLRSATGALGLSVAKLESSTDISHQTDVNIGRDAQLQQTGTTITNDTTDGIDIRAKNIIDVQEKVKAESHNLLSGGSISKAEIVVESNANIDLAESSQLDALGDINLNSHSYNQVRTVSEARTGGIISGARVDAKTHVTPTDTITLHDDAKVLSQGEVALTAGISGTDFSGTEGSDSSENALIDANANMTILALVPAPSGKSQAETKYDRTHTITVHDGAEIASARDTSLFAHEGTPIVEERGVTNTFYGGRTFDKNPSQTDNIGVTVDGTVRSRRVEEKTITFEESANGTIQAVREVVVDGERVQLGNAETVGTSAPAGVTVYQGAYGGDRTLLSAGRYANLTASNLNGFNNAISSLKIPAGYQAVLYTEANFQGDRVVITADTNLSQINQFNNKISSLEILHDPNAAIDYRYQNSSNTSANIAPAEDPITEGELISIRGPLGIRSDLTNIYIGDFNGDGKDDFIRQEKGSSDNDNVNTAQTYISQGDGSFSRHSLSESFNIKGDSTTLHVGDFNGDGKDDFISQENNNRRGAIFYSKGNGYFNRYTLTKDYALNRDVTNLYIGDFNGDGKDDFLRQEKGRWDDDSNNTANVFLSKGNTSFTRHNLSDGFKGDLTNLYIGDFNGDGKDDILRQEKGSWDNDSNNTANAFLSKGNGSFTKHNLPDELKGDLTNLYLGDFNGDGKDDFIRQEKGSWDNNYYNTANVFLSNGNGSFAKNTLSESFNLKGDLTKLHVGDFNGDGRDDFIRQSRSSSTNGGADIFMANGSGVFSRSNRATEKIFAGNQSVLYAGDFNGDGYDDFFQQFRYVTTGKIGHGFSDTARAAAVAQANFETQFSAGSISGGPIIEIEDTSLQLGRILVTGDYLNGSGTLDAAGNSKIEILNNSRASLEINKIDVSDTGGGFYFNYAPTEAGDIQTFATVRTLTTDGHPKVIIQNTSGSLTGIEINGDINNLLGTIQADNAVGDTIVNGNLRAHTIDIATGGSVVQGYTRGTRHLGGTAERKWWETAEASAIAGKKVDKGIDDSNAAIIGDNVFIAGEYINVNGTVQAGRANHSVLIANNDAFRAAIANFNQQFANNNSKYLFDFNSSGHGITTVDDRHKLVRLQWNAREQQIEAHSIEAAGGNLELHGRIYSTGNGKLKALDGHAQIQIENNTGYDLKLNALNNSEVSGKIKITDTSRAGNSPYGFHVTEIERIGETIHTTINGTASSSTNGRNATYDPKANQVYRFETQQKREETKYRRKVERGTALGNSFFRVVHNTYHEDRKELTDVAKSTVKQIPNSGKLVSNQVQSSTYYFQQLGQKTSSAEESPYRYQGLERASTYRSWDYEKERTYYQIHRHSIDADRAIAINFIGHDEGIVNVQSRQSDIILDGTVNNDDGITTLEAKAISTTDEGVLWSSTVALTAQNDIDLSIQGSANSGTVEATTTQGDIHIDYLNSVIEQANLSAQNGDISFTADLDINGGTFTGKNINLNAIAGKITAEVNTKNTATFGLSAAALGEIHLTGTPKIYQVTSPEGVYLNGEFQGTHFEGQASSEETYQTLLSSFTEFASQATIDDHIAAIEASKQADYTQYWQLRHEAGGTFNPDTYSFTYSASQKNDLQAEGMSNGEIADQEHATTEWMRSRHEAFNNPTEYDPNYTYQVSQEEKIQLEDTLFQTQQAWQTQVNFLGGYQQFQAFFEAVSGNGIPSNTTQNYQVDREPMSALVVGGGSSSAVIQPPNYQISNLATGEINTINRDELLATLTEEQKEALIQAGW